jgi:hypothetical protein
MRKRRSLPTNIADFDREADDGVVGAGSGSAAHQLRPPHSKYRILFCLSNRWLSRCSACDTRRLLRHVTALLRGRRGDALGRDLRPAKVQIEPDRSVRRV